MSHDPSPTLASFEEQLSEARGSLRALCEKRNAVKQQMRAQLHAYRCRESALMRAYNDWMDTTTLHDESFDEATERLHRADAERGAAWADFKRLERQRLDVERNELPGAAARCDQLVMQRDVAAAGWHGESVPPSPE